MFLFFFPTLKMYFKWYSTNILCHSLTTNNVSYSGVHNTIKFNFFLFLICVKLISKIFLQYYSIKNNVLVKYFDIVTQYIHLHKGLSIYWIYLYIWIMFIGFRFTKYLTIKMHGYKSKHSLERSNKTTRQ